MKRGPLGLLDLLLLKAMVRINEVRFIRCLESFTLSMSYGFLEMGAKLSRKLKALLKGKKKKKVSRIQTEHGAAIIPSGCRLLACSNNKQWLFLVILSLNSILLNLRISPADSVRFPFIGAFLQ